MHVDLLLQGFARLCNLYYLALNGSISLVKVLILKFQSPFDYYNLQMSVSLG